MQFGNSTTQGFFNSPRLMGGNTNPFFTSHIIQQYFLQTDTSALISFAKVSQSDVVREEPLVFFEANTFSVRSSTTIANARSVIIHAPHYRLEGATSSRITNAASLYIDGAPQAISGTGIVIDNNYALWVDGGTVRFDGNVVTGAATTQTK